MAKARQKPSTAGEQSPAVLPAAPSAREKRYRVNRPFSYADVAYAVGDTSPPFDQDAAARIRRYAGADALTDVADANG